mmetsp:Transcript_7851/g.12583  ORF Transcript_7851/g.12583 Transcript_7851/m.12583 type:complete len:100 (-) Transcript_7851:112-411(-)
MRQRKYLLLLLLLPRVTARQSVEKKVKTLVTVKIHPFLKFLDSLCQKYTCCSSNIEPNNLKITTNERVESTQATKGSRSRRDVENCDLPQILKVALCTD